MPNTYFRFRQFVVHQERTAMKVCTDACLFGAWTAAELNNDAERILDIGAGTGLLSLILAQQMTADFDAVEIDEDAYKQSAENFDASPWKERLHIHHTSLQQFVPPYQYDLIICNPPFYENDLRSEDKKRNVALHSDALSVHELLASVKRLLKPGGSFSVLLPWRRKEEFENKVKDAGFFICKRAVVKNEKRNLPYTQNPFRVMYILKNSPSSFTEEEFVIKDERFYALLKDYYL